MRIFTNTHYDFIRWRWHAIALSWVIILSGLALIVSQGGPRLGIDFSGGTLVIYKFQPGVTEDAVRHALDAIPGDKVVQKYGDASVNETLIRLPHAGAESGAELGRAAEEIKKALSGAKLGSFEEISREVVGPVVGKDLQQKGIYATIASILGLGVYIAVRFRFAFAVGACVATFHDILITLAFLTFFQYELSLNIIAAILTIAGYSVNDTIVVFDRVRENLGVLRRDNLATVVNESVNQTLGRTVITSGTTFLAVLSLYLFGGEVLKGFAFTMLVGIVTGTYSTVFIAAAVAIIMSKRQAKVVAAPSTSTDRARRKAKVS